MARRNDLRMGERELLHFDLGINLRLDIFFPFERRRVKKTYGEGRHDHGRITGNV